jgi:chemotaxis response regulator CheB
MNAYDLICQIVQHEIGYGFQAEAIKAQAVACYSFIKYNNAAGIAPAVLLSPQVSSAVSQAVFEAMEAGAVDFVVKPDSQQPNGVETFIRDLIQKIKTASAVQSAPARVPGAAVKVLGHLSKETNEVIAIGASTGGTEAIYSILHALPPTIPGIVIVQHIPPLFSRMFAERLNSQTTLTVREAQNGDYLEPGKVLIAPGDRHMRIKKIGKRYQAECFSGEKVNGHCRLRLRFRVSRRHSSTFSTGRQHKENSQHVEFAANGRKDDRIIAFAPLSCAAGIA